MKEFQKKKKKEKRKNEIEFVFGRKKETFTKESQGLFGKGI